jgi:hypothetical protein
VSASALFLLPIGSWLAIVLLLLLLDQCRQDLLIRIGIELEKDLAQAERPIQDRPKKWGENQIRLRDPRGKEGTK